MRLMQRVFYSHSERYLKFCNAVAPALVFGSSVVIRRSARSFDASSMIAPAVISHVPTMGPRSIGFRQFGSGILAVVEGAPVQRLHAACIVPVHVPGLRHDVLPSQHLCKRGPWHKRCATANVFINRLMCCLSISTRSETTCHKRCDIDNCGSRSSVTQKEGSRVCPAHLAGFHGQHVGEHIPVHRLAAWWRCE